MGVGIGVEVGTGDGVAVGVGVSVGGVGCRGYWCRRGWRWRGGGGLRPTSPLQAGLGVGADVAVDVGVGEGSTAPSGPGTCADSAATGLAETESDAVSLTAPPSSHAVRTIITATAGSMPPALSVLGNRIGLYLLCGLAKFAGRKVDRARPIAARNPRGPMLPGFFRATSKPPAGFLTRPDGLAILESPSRASWDANPKG